MNETLVCATCGDSFERPTKPGVKPTSCSRECKTKLRHRREAEIIARGRSGVCECGCGMATEAAPRTSKEKGWVAGEPMRFVRGHNARGVRRREGPDYLVNAESGCWEWQHAQVGNGYGRGTFDGVEMLSHRYYYEASKGAIPPGLDLDHLCRNRICCNPEHLEAVSRAENARRGSATKLTADEIRAIRLSPKSASQIAADYGMTKSGIATIRARRTWRDV